MARIERSKSYFRCRTHRPHLCLNRVRYFLTTEEANACISSSICLLLISAIVQAVRLTQEQYNGLCHQNAQEH